METFFQKNAPMLLSYGARFLEALVILVMGLFLAKWLRKLFRRLVSRSRFDDPTLTPFIGEVVRTVILVITIVAVLQKLGVATTSIITIVGAAGLAIGLALQGTLSNVASGVMLLIFRPFSVGDNVETGGLRGVVERIGLFATRMRTLDNIFILMPNSKIWGVEIKNFSRNATRRIDLTITVNQQENAEKIIQKIQQLCEQNPRVLKDPPPFVGLGEYNHPHVQIVIQPWVDAKDFQQVRSELLLEIKNYLAQPPATSKS